MGVGDVMKWKAMPSEGQGKKGAWKAGTEVSDKQHFRRWGEERKDI